MHNCGSCGKLVEVVETLWKPCGKAVELVENNSFTENNKRYATSMVVQTIRYSCLTDISQYYNYDEIRIRPSHLEKCLIFEAEIA